MEINRSLIGPNFLGFTNKRSIEFNRSLIFQHSEDLTKRSFNLPVRNELFNLILFL